MPAFALNSAVAFQDDGETAVQAGVAAHIYSELQRLARRQLARRRSLVTLDTGGLVHEAYLRLSTSRSAATESRAHFFNLSARVMRQILCDHARKRLRERRWMESFADEQLADAAREQARHLVALDGALDALARKAPRQAHVVECRYFSGLDTLETAEALGISARTVEREWRTAREWLARELTLD